MGTTNSRNRKLLIRSLVVVALAIVVLTVRLTERIDVDRTPADRFEIVRVTDGDSMELRGGDRLRLLAVDTPEKGEPLYNEATEFLAGLVLHKVGELEFSGRKRDRYGRLLAYLYIDSILINEQILRNGLGYLYLFDDTDKDKPELKRLFQAQQDAMDDGRGVWSLSHTPEAYYLARKGGYRLHRSGCNSLRNINPDNYLIFKTRNEGLRLGLSPCRNCKP
jgi:micrococcal nuclease